MKGLASLGAQPKLQRLPIHETSAPASRTLAKTRAGPRTNWPRRSALSRSAVAQWETGRAGQVTTNLTRVAAALGVGVEHLMVRTRQVRPWPSFRR